MRRRRCSPIWRRGSNGDLTRGRLAGETATAGETVIAKRYLDSFADTPLRETLDGLGVGHVVICGAATDACIRSTTQRAQIEGYDVTLVADGHTTDEGPWPLPLPDGTTIPIGAEQMVAYTNFFVADTEYPAITTRVLPAAEVAFSS